MKNPKIYIAFQFTEKAWGGGNQFLRALRKTLIIKGLFEKNPSNADCILFNSHQYSI